MRRADDDSLREWLRAEERGEADTADAALLSLFRDLPPEAPPPAFAERTLARARVAGALRAEPEGAPVPVAARLAALWLALMSLGTLLGSGYLLTALPRLDLGVGVWSFTRLLSEGWQWIASGLIFWERLAEIGSLVAKVLEVPEVSAIVLASLVLAATALRVLQGILADERKWTYVE